MTDPFPDRLQLVLRVRILPGDVPGQVRMKRLLKTLLRSYGCICTDIRLDGSGDSAGAVTDSASQSCSK